MLLVHRTVPGSDQEQHRKPRKPLSQLSFLAQKSTYGVSNIRTAPGSPTSRGMTSTGHFFYFVFMYSRDPKFFLDRFSADTRVPELSKQLSKTLYIESDTLDLRPRVCFGSWAKSAFGTKILKLGCRARVLRSPSPKMSRIH